MPQTNLLVPTRNTQYFHMEDALFYPRDIRGFPQFLYENFCSIHFLGQDHYLPNPLKFRVHSSHEHLMGYSPDLRQRREITNLNTRCCYTEKVSLCVAQLFDYTT